MIGIGPEYIVAKSVANQKPDGHRFKGITHPERYANGDGRVGADSSRRLPVDVQYIDRFDRRPTAARSRGAPIADQLLDFANAVVRFALGDDGVVVVEHLIRRTVLDKQAVVEQPRTIT